MDSINNIKDLHSFYKTVQYGILDRKYNKPCKENSLYNWDHIWKLNTPEETKQYLVGNCYDTVALTISYMKKWGLKYKVFFACTVRNDEDYSFNDPTHCFVLCFIGTAWVWIEGSWNPENKYIKAISLEKLIKYVGKKLANACGYSNRIRIVEGFPDYGSDMHTFDRYMIKQRKIYDIKPDYQYERF